ncbi:MAG: helix-turn-helix domain-containing protein [Phycisphaerae bacterium]|nr:helix-turn-helix domain-containing protein [Phycisphaerae bacterium]
MLAPTTSDICRRIAGLRLEIAGPRGKASFAKALRLSPSTYDYYERSRVPPADVLVRIAERTGVDLYWLLTGQMTAGLSPGADHPLVQRVAKLLADKPDSAGPLAAFLDVLMGIQAFPAGERQAAAEPARAEGTSRPRGDEPGPMAPGQPAEPAKGSWVPILGRTAAGVVHFWADARDSAGVTMLADLVERHRRRAGASVRPAAAMEQGGPGAETVQIITLPGGGDSEAAEFVAAPALKARYADAFALRIDGESMAPEIRHGDVVILSPSVPAADGRPAVVQLAGQIGVICKLYRRVGERVHLIPIHERYAVQSFPASKVSWALAVVARVRM